VPKELDGKTVTVRIKFDLAPVEVISQPIKVKL